MQKTIERAVLGVQLGLVVIGGLFVALGFNAMLSAVLLDLMPSGGAESPKEAPTEAEQDQEELIATGVLQFNRNLFNQGALDTATGDAGSVDEGEPEGEFLGEELEPDVGFEPPPGAPVLSDLRVLLIGTQVADDPAWSLAIMKPVEGGGEGETLYQRVGSTLLEDATIFHIERNRVFFYRHSKGDQVEYVDIETTLGEVMARGKAKPEPAPKASASAQPKGGSGEKTSAAAASSKKVSSVSGLDLNAIERGEGGEYRIPRDMAEYVRANPKALKDPKFGQPPQIQPVYRGGGVGGFRVLGVQSSSVYAKLGIQNGDIILDVNGQVVDNPQKALSFFDQLGPGQDVGVKINRRGRHRTLTYKLK